MNSVGAPELVIILLIFGMVILPIAILVLVFRNTRRRPVPPSDPGPPGPPPTTLL